MKMTIRRILLIALILNFFPYFGNLWQEVLAASKSTLDDSALKDLVRADQKLGDYSPGLKQLKQYAKDAAELESYTVKVKIWTFKKSGTRLDGGLFHYLQPDLVKVKVTEGKRKGSTVVRRKDGKIKGHMNNAFKVFVRTLQPDSKRLYATNGYHLLNSDLASLLSRAVKEAKGPGTVLISNSPIMVEMARSRKRTEKVKSRIIELYDSADQKCLTTRIYLDSDTNLPVQWCDYKDNKPCFITRFIDLNMDKELTCKNFDLGFHIPVP